MPPVAQPPAQPPQRQPVITPPVVTKDEGAKYPQQAIDDKVTTPTEVVVILELDAAGAVKNATIDKSGDGHGFDDAALEAAKKLVFDPAKRDGKPIAAKIRHRYTFTPPPAQLVGRVATQLRDAPIEGATITATGADGTAHTATTGADGTWKLDGLPFGKYTLTIAAGGYQSATDEEQLDPGMEAKVELRLVRPEAPPPTAVPMTADGGDAGAEQVEEVTVKGEKPPREVTKRTLEQRELTRIPGTNGDALRAIQNLPGMARSPGLAGLLIVRGAAPQETGTYVDGTYVPLIYHFGGLSSVIPSEMLDKIDFYPGNFSSYFGRHSGGVIDVGVKDPEAKKTPDSGLVAAREGVHGLVQMDFIDMRAVVQGPVADTGWKFELGGRRSYVDVWLKPALEQLGSSVTTAPVYYDYQAVLQRSWDHGKHSVRFFFFGSDDRLAVLVKQVNASAPALTGSLGLGTAFYRMQARYVGKLSDDYEIRAVAAVGKDALQFNLGNNFFNIFDYPVSGRVELQQKMAVGVKNNVGVDMLYEPYTVNLQLPPIPTPGQPPAGPFGSQPPLTFSGKDSITEPAFYDEFELTPYKGTRIVPGVRLDYTNTNQDWDVSPRLNRASGPHERIPAHDVERRHRPLRESPAAARDECRLRQTGHALDDYESIWVRRRTRVYASSRGLARGLLSPVRQPHRPRTGQYRLGSCVRPRDADSLQAGRPLLRIHRVHALAQRAPRRAGRAGASLPVRPDAYSDRGRQLSPRRWLGGRAPLPVRVR